MMCAVTVRQIKPDSYEDFRAAWEPRPWLPRLKNALVFRSEDNPDLVLTIGFFDCGVDEFDAAVRDDPKILREEEERLHRIAGFEQQVLLNGIFELVEDVHGER